MKFENSPAPTGTFLVHMQVKNLTVSRPLLVLKKKLKFWQIVQKSLLPLNVRRLKINSRRRNIRFSSFKKKLSFFSVCIRIYFHLIWPIILTPQNSESRCNSEIRDQPRKDDWKDKPYHDQLNGRGYLGFWQRDIEKCAWFRSMNLHWMVMSFPTSTFPAKKQ